MAWGFALAGLIAAGGTIASSEISQGSANKASQIEQQQFDTTTANLTPFVQGGTNAFNALNTALGLTAPGGGPGTGQINTAGFTGSPGYNFQLQGGTNAVLNNASALGGVNSGNTLKALSSYGTGLANQDWYNYLASLGGVANTGENAAAMTGQIGANTAATIGSNTIGAGNVMAGGVNSLSNNAALFALLASNPNNMFGTPTNQGNGAGSPGGSP